MTASSGRSRSSPRERRSRSTGSRRKSVRVFSLAERCLEVDAFSIWRREHGFVFLDTMKSAEHSRFDTAHELGHLVLRRHGEPQGRPAELGSMRAVAVTSW